MTPICGPIRMNSMGKISSPSQLQLRSIDGRKLYLPEEQMTRLDYRGGDPSLPEKDLTSQKASRKIKQT